MAGPARQTSQLRRNAPASDARDLGRFGIMLPLSFRRPPPTSIQVTRECNAQGRPQGTKKVTPGGPRAEMPIVARPSPSRSPVPPTHAVTEALLIKRLPKSRSQQMVKPHPRTALPLVLFPDKTPGDCLREPCPVAPKPLSSAPPTSVRVSGPIFPGRCIYGQF